MIRTLNTRSSAWTVQKHDVRRYGGRAPTYPMTLTTDELGEIPLCISKGKSHRTQARKLGDLDFKRSFRLEMDELTQHLTRVINGRIRELEYRDVD